MPVLDDLLDSIFDDRTSALYPEFGDWVRASRRFRAFSAANRVKIRAKLRHVNDDGSLKDLRAELETAALLLQDERFTVEYEKLAASRQRAPDFTVTFKTHTPFNVEVRRIRSAELSDRDAGARTGKLMAVLCDKVGQMPPGSINLLWLAAESEITEDDLVVASTTLRQLAERKVEEFFTRRGFESAAGFLRYHRRLSGIVLRQSGYPLVWLNSLAGHKVPPEIVTAVKRLEIG